MIILKSNFMPVNRKSAKQINLFVSLCMVCGIGCILYRLYIIVIGMLYGYITYNILYDYMLNNLHIYLRNLICCMVYGVW